MVRDRHYEHPLIALLTGILNLQLEAWTASLAYQTMAWLQVLKFGAVLSIYPSKTGGAPLC